MTPTLLICSTHPSPPTTPPSYFLVLFALVEISPSLFTPWPSILDSPGACDPTQPHPLLYKYSPGETEPQPCCPWLCTLRCCVCHFLHSPHEDGSRLLGSLPSSWSTTPWPRTLSPWSSPSPWPRAPWSSPSPWPWAPWSSPSPWPWTPWSSPSPWSLASWSSPSPLPWAPWSSPSPWPLAPWSSPSPWSTSLRNEKTREHKMRRLHRTPS
ncbi:chromosome alignment-maintaining phosphoprotein 1-like [Microtus oregoni]|uniref:chromosome alignment-maintaining phosphoprotein 1-like n=1 Tax=Microtus oregoni TaxID=111838 RepID=UPI001BB22A8C|nr:chromosome alignment-maintaining phosphoprotein 1-like [Microtus oregoni]